MMRGPAGVGIVTAINNALLLLFVSVKPNTVAANIKFWLFPTPSSGCESHSFEHT